MPTIINANSAAWSSTPDNNWRAVPGLTLTFTTANASAFATGHQLGDTGDFSNTIYVGRPVASANNSVASPPSNPATSMCK